MHFTVERFTSFSPEVEFLPSLKVEFTV